MGNATSIFDCAVNPLAPMPDDGDDIEDGPLTLEDRVPLRDSLLWRLQRQYYDQMGIRPWTEGVVPNFVSCNAFVARAYARTLLGFLRDVHAGEKEAGVPAAHPLYILEVGSGHGKLAYLVVEALLRFRAFLPPSPTPRIPPFVYIVTDPVPSVLAYVRAHPALAEWVSAGFVDTAVWDAEKGGEMVLQGSGAVLRPGSLSRPTAVIASYVLDSLRADAVRVYPTGEVGQGTVTVHTPRRVDTQEALSHDMLARVQVMWGYRPIPLEDGLFTAPAYSPTTAPGRVLQGLVRAYAATPRLRQVSATVLVPVAGAYMLDHLMQLTGGRMLLLVGDKGISHLSEMDGPPLPRHVGPVKADVGGPAKEEAPRLATQADPPLALHGSFSFPVNLHALRVLTRAYGGRILSTPALEGFKVAAALFGHEDPRKEGQMHPLTAVFPMQGMDPVTAALPHPSGLPPSPPTATASLMSYLLAQEAVAEKKNKREKAKQEGQGEGEGDGLLEHEEEPTLAFMPGQAGTRLPSYAIRPKAPATTTPSPCCKDGGCEKEKKAKEEGGGQGEESVSGQTPCKDAPHGFDESLEQLYVDPQAEWPTSHASVGVWSHTRRALGYTLHGFTPEDFAVLQRCIKEETGAAGPSIRHALSLLRLSCHDPDVFLKVKGAIIDKGAVGAGEAGYAMGMDIRSDVERVYAAHYSLQPSRDVCFELGRVLMGQKDYMGAVHLFRTSNEQCGAHHVTWHNQGLCYYHMGDVQSAAQCFDAALSLHADYGEARLWRDKMTARLTPVHAGAGAGAGAHAGMQGEVDAGQERPEISAGLEEEREDEREPHPAAHTHSHSHSHGHGQGQCESGHGHSHGPSTGAGVGDDSHSEDLQDEAEQEYDSEEDESDEEHEYEKRRAI